MTTAWLARPLRSLRDALEFGDTSRQLALGLALGVVLGLVPKGNLLCVGLCLVALATRVNLGMTMISAVVFSLLSPLADPLTHRIGLALLTWDLLRPVWDVAYGLPLAAWTAFNNTVVLGSLTLGLGLLLPTYWVAKFAFERTGPTAPRRLRPIPSFRSYVASTGPIRIDGANEAFQPRLAMAEPQGEADLEDLKRGRRIEPAHPHVSAPVLPSLPHVEASASLEH